jgi:hypothetical protein
MVMNVEVGRAWTEVLMAYFKVHPSDCLEELTLYTKNLRRIASEGRNLSPNVSNYEAGLITTTNTAV